MNTQETLDIENFSYDNGPEEPELCDFNGYDDCGSCFFRINFVKRVTDKVKQSEA